MSLVHRVIIADDEAYFREYIRGQLANNFIVDEADCLERAIDLLQQNYYDLAFIDLTFEEDLHGFSILKLSVEKGVFSVILTSHDHQELIDKGYALGCDSFFIKNSNVGNISNIIHKYLQARNSFFNFDKFIEGEFITQDQDTILKLKDIMKLRSSEIEIFILGPTGVGKTLLAKKIHAYSDRRLKKFVHLNCSEIQPALIESELFGHVKGAFTGAIKNKKGKLELADGGTLFLDEIGTLSLDMQVKLLKSIDEKTFYPVGSNNKVTSSFRLISATCDDIVHQLKVGVFRTDLYFRLSGLNIRLKGLNQRKSDVGLLFKHFFKNKNRVSFSEQAKLCIENYSWPGNIRELKKFVRIISEKSFNIVELKDLPEEMLLNPPALSTSILSSDHFSFLEKYGWNEFHRHLKSEVILRFNEKYGWKMSLKILKISRNWWYANGPTKKSQDNIKRGGNESNDIDT